MMTGRPAVIREARISLDVMCYAAGVQGSQHYDEGSWKQGSVAGVKHCYIK